MGPKYPLANTSIYHLSTPIPDMCKFYLEDS